uniref:Uncharacterized protein n=1 Tax=Sphaerodactylus townsendi TaxID=933632 RepID=A0ACB8FYW1_9SAUR
MLKVLDEDVAAHFLNGQNSFRDNNISDNDQGGSFQNLILEQEPENFAILYEARETSSSDFPSHRLTLNSRGGNEEQKELHLLP